MSDQTVTEAVPGIAEGWYWCPELRKPVPIAGSTDGVDWPECWSNDDCEASLDAHHRLLIEGDADAPLAAALALALELASFEPIERSVTLGQGHYADVCRLCNGEGAARGGTVRHEPGCLWVAARAIEDELR